MLRLILCFGALSMTPAAYAQTMADPDFDTSVESPAFAEGEGTLVLIDEGHNNWHTGSGRYAPAADVLRNDGYRVSAHRGKFTAESLEEAGVVIIVSAIEDGFARAMADGIDAEEVASWPLPVVSAFSSREIDVLVDWVGGGGALLLIVDYMPLAGMSAKLAAGFGVHIANGYAYDAAGENHVTFTRSAGTLRGHAVTDGHGPDERIDRVQTFAGTALLVPYGAEPLLLFDRSAYVVLPEAISPGDTPPPADAPRHSIAGWSQGAVMDVGDGRFAVFGEHAMFSAQRFPEGGVTGMNVPSASQNKQFLLNVVRWLAGVL